MKFSIDVEMEDRWVPYFIGMLKKMESDGNIGHSELIGFYADGDGDFRPKFNFSEPLPTIDAKHIHLYHGSDSDDWDKRVDVSVYDAG